MLSECIFEMHAFMGYGFKATDLLATVLLDTGTIVSDSKFDSVISFWFGN